MPDMADDTEDEAGSGGFLNAVRAGAHVPPEVPPLDELLEEALGPPRHKGRVERLEEGATIAFFIAMFITIIMGVFWRYVLGTPLVWTVNAATIAFIWVIMLGSGPANHGEEHIQFDLLYNRMKPEMQRACRILGNLLIILPFALVIPGTVEYLQFMGGNKVTGLNLTFDWAYSAVLIFFVATILHRGRMLLVDLRRRPKTDTTR